MFTNDEMARLAAALVGPEVESDVAEILLARLIGSPTMNATDGNRLAGLVNECLPPVECRANPAVVASGEWPAGDFRRTVLEDAALAAHGAAMMSVAELSDAEFWERFNKTLAETKTAYAKIDYSDNGLATKYAAIDTSTSQDSGDEGARSARGDWHSLSPRGVVPRTVPVGGHEVEVTPEMMAAGLKRLHDTTTDLSGGRDIVRSIYAEMHALASIPLVSDGELQAVRERDEAKSHARTLEDSLNRALHDLGTARAEAHYMKRQMAAFTAANVAPKVEPKPMHDFTRLPRRDGRLMGA